MIVMLMLMQMGMTMAMWRRGKLTYLAAIHLNANKVYTSLLIIKKCLKKLFGKRVFYLIEGKREPSEWSSK